VLIERKYRPAFVTALLCAMLVLSFAAVGCSKGDSNDRMQVDVSSSSQTLKGTSDDPAPGAFPLVTFVELGSDRCIPCIKMREIMNEIEDRYGEQVCIVFYDVWTPDGEPYARQFGIRVIPTQVFLDAKGQEYFRHEGYFPITEVAKILDLKAVRLR
jgi:thioredoxin 1